MTHMLTRHCSAQAVVDSGLTSSRGRLTRDWLGAMPAGLDPRQLQRTCTGKSARWWVIHLRGTAGRGRGRLGLHLLTVHSHTCLCQSFVFHLAATRTTPSRLITSRLPVCNIDSSYRPTGSKTVVENFDFVECTLYKMFKRYLNHQCSLSVWIFNDNEQKRSNKAK